LITSITFLQNQPNQDTTGKNEQRDEASRTAQNKTLMIVVAPIKSDQKTNIIIK
jgi:hypothetical protein